VSKYLAQNKREGERERERGREAFTGERGENPRSALGFIFGGRGREENGGEREGRRRGGEIFTC
jgi:hypothetical protein